MEYNNKIVLSRQEKVVKYIFQIMTIVITESQKNEDYSGTFDTHFIMDKRSFN